MIDESLDTKNLSAEPEPWEFRAKPAWQRLIVMMGGIIVNVITGVIVFILLVYSQGETYISKDEVNEHGIVAYELGRQIGFQDGDKVISVNGNDFQKFKELRGPDVLLSDNGYYLVERNGEQVRINIPNNFIDNFSERRNSEPFISVRNPFEVGRITPGSNAEKGGLKEGDRFQSVNGNEIQYFHEFSAALDTLNGQTIAATVLRNGQEKQLELQVSEEGKIGFAVNSLLDLSSVDYSFGQALGKGTAQAFNIVWVNIRAFQKMFAGDVDPQKSLSGPIGIAKFFGGTWDWVNFWQITGLLSMVLAFMNFLPIPALDGGHVMFLTWEIVSGRKPSDRFLENAQKVGMILLLGIMSFAIFNDIVKLF
jgi:regulator of sigma E protease